ncbi:hypothetical protein DCO56_03620 [Sphingobacterium athyrii]|uniref:Uncharacterized protein n=1 Tax=Sphingobacterium athyrii TaxID=2152717 RepID=A0A363NZA8_9SPHI|nr:hypothetical protein DCO56_03620 [Sphingobacterium athyrii]
MGLANDKSLKYVFIYFELRQINFIQKSNLPISPLPLGFLLARKLNKNNKLIKKSTHTLLFNKIVAPQ